MALQIPQQPIDSRVDLPPVPQNPSTLSDINQAMIYKRMPVVIDSASKVWEFYMLLFLLNTSFFQGAIISTPQVLRM